MIEPHRPSASASSRANGRATLRTASVDKAPAGGAVGVSAATADRVGGSAPELRRRELKTEEKNRARCRRFGARYVERVRLSVVYDRDLGGCWLCGGQTLLHPPAGAVVPDRRGGLRPLPHPQLATLDHVVSLAEQGDHSYANIRLAHQLCNARTERPSPEVLREMLTGVRARWEANADVAGRLTEVGYAAASLRGREGFGSSPDPPGHPDPSGLAARLFAGPGLRRS